MKIMLFFFTFAIIGGPLVAQYNPHSGFLGLNYYEDENLLPGAAGAGKYGIMITSHAAAYTNIEAIKTATPNIKVFMYQNAAASVADCHYEDHRLAGVAYTHADCEHEDWFLHHHTTGQRLTYPDYTYLKPMKIGDDQYQIHWARFAAEHAQYHSYDGVFLDDVNPEIRHGLNGQIQEYTDAQYGAAMVDFMQYTHTYLTDQNVLTMANIGAHPYETASQPTVNQLSAYIDFYSQENWNSSGGNLKSGQLWLGYIQQMEQVEAAGKNFIAIAYSSVGNRVQMRYLWGSWLLAWDGIKESAFVFKAFCGCEPCLCDNWHRDWTVDIGTPIENRTAVGLGWKRRYTEGITVVNPSSTTAQTFQLGANYWDLDGVQRSQITLQPTTGMILTNTPASLAAEVLDLKGSVVGEEIELTWTYFSADEPLSYQMERSPNSIDFQPIGILAPSHHSHQGAYSFLDEHPMQGTNYYRLKMSQLDGTVVYSPVIALRMNALEAFQLLTSLVTEQLIIARKGDSHPRADLQLFDAAGRLVLKDVFLENQSEKVIHVGDLVAGSYHLSVRTGAHIQVIPWMKI